MTKSRTQSGDPNRHTQTVITQLDLDRLWIRTTSAPERVIPAIGLKRFIDAVGLDLIVRYYVEELGMDKFLEILLAKHRQQLRETSEPPTAAVLPPPTPRVE